MREASERGGIIKVKVRVRGQVWVRVELRIGLVRVRVGEGSGSSKEAIAHMNREHEYVAENEDGRDGLQGDLLIWETIMGENEGLRRGGRRWGV